MGMYDGSCSDDTPQRVVCLQPSATVILAALGRLDRVVACTRYCADVCPEVKNSGRSIIADSWTAQSRQIMAARPDLVIAAVPYQEKAVVEILKAGVRFLGLAPKTLADIYTDIATIAGVVGAGERGQCVIADMQREIETLRARVTSKQRPRVFCEEWGKPLIASQKWVAELVEVAGGEFMGEPGRQSSAGVGSGPCPGGRRCCVVRGRGPRAAAEDCPRAGMAGDACGARRPGVLHPR